MTKEEVFEFIRDNLKIEVSISADDPYCPSQHRVEVTLRLVNPASGVAEEVDWSIASI